MNKPIKWFHSLTLNGEVMPGDRPADILEREAAAVFAHPLVGKSVLDIGAWDGYFSFEAERRGAARRRRRPGQMGTRQWRGRRSSG